MWVTIDSLDTRVKLDRMRRSASVGKIKMCHVPSSCPVRASRLSYGAGWTLASGPAASHCQAWPSWRASTRLPGAPWLGCWPSWPTKAWCASCPGGGPSALRCVPKRTKHPAKAHRARQEQCSLFVSPLCYADQMNASRTARERVRAELTREITDVARGQLATEGAGGLSLRAVAREMG